MGSWQKTLSHYLPHHHAEKFVPIVYSRDFAYADNAPIQVLDVEPHTSQRMAAACADIHIASAKAYAELLAGPIVDISVGQGPSKRDWSLHRNLLCHHSSYFEAEFQGHEMPKKQDVRKLDLPDDDPRGFELLVKWLYQGHLEDGANLADDNAKYDYAVACHKLYLLCDKFDMIRLKNLAMDQYRRCLNEAQLVPDAEEINEMYRASPSASPFRGLVVKIAARQVMDPDIDRDAEAYRKCFEQNPGFAVEMINAVRYMSGGMLFDDPTIGDACEYHDHNGANPCIAQAGVKKNPKLQINGTGSCPSSTRSTRQSQLLLLPPQHVAELSSEKRTPKKLATPKKEQMPAATVNSTPNPKSPISAKRTTSTAKPRVASGLSNTPAKLQKQHALRTPQSLPLRADNMRIPSKATPSERKVPPSISASVADGVTPHPNVESPTVARHKMIRRHSSKKNGTANNSPDNKLSESTNSLAHVNGNSASIPAKGLFPPPPPSSIVSTNSSISAETARSRKRKFAERGSSGKSSDGTKTTTSNSESDRPRNRRPMSVANGTRGAAKGSNRVNQIARRSDGARQWDAKSGSDGHESGITIGKRAPPKLRVASVSEE